MKVLDARLTYFIDNLGKRYANAPDLEILVDHIPRDQELSWEFEYQPDGDIGMFYASIDGFWRTYFHNNDGMNHGGLGGAALKLPMKDGGYSVIAGPWCGNPRQAYDDFTEIPQLVDVTLYEGSFHQGGIANFWAEHDTVIKALKFVRFPGYEQLRAILLLNNKGSGLQEYDYAIIKRSGGEGREAPKLVRAEW